MGSRRQVWYEYGVKREYHCSDGTVSEQYDCRKMLHRLDGPAVVLTDGTKKWYQNGERHRLDGPAIEWGDGSRDWYQNDRRHRLDGPAAEYTDGSKYWHIRGEELTEEQFDRHPEVIKYRMTRLMDEE